MVNGTRIVFCRILYMLVQTNKRTCILTRSRFSWTWSCNGGRLSRTSVE